MSDAKTGPWLWQVWMVLVLGPAAAAAPAGGFCWVVVWCLRSCKRRPGGAAQPLGVPGLIWSLYCLEAWRVIFVPHNSCFFADVAAAFAADWIQHQHTSFVERIAALS